MKSGIRLSQCMIVKNEEKNIRQALNWGKGIVYEQIVVDTGSTDKMVEIAEEFGAKVFHLPWYNDFQQQKKLCLTRRSVCLISITVTIS
ncbi:glycosyltransferase [Lacrimispora sp.]|uniref:glycosyltransferase n=1 Tax=Lacrimispora sp. TaxID=2719234 RepID=UPI00345FF6EB